MCEVEKSVVELHDISASIMEVLLDFVYTETVNVSVENVQDLLPAACLLQLTGRRSNTIWDTILDAEKGGFMRKGMF